MHRRRRRRRLSLPLFAIQVDGNTNANTGTDTDTDGVNDDDSGTYFIDRRPYIDDTKSICHLYPPKFWSFSKKGLQGTKFDDDQKDLNADPYENYLAHENFVESEASS